MVRGRAYAKVNLGLRVGRRRADGFHPLRGIFQSIDLSDELSLEPAEADRITADGGAPVPDDFANLAWRALAAVRREAGASQPMSLTLDKGIPTAAGLGGGSADAAATLALAARHFGVSMDTLRRLAPDLGSDVPFCLLGGTAWVAGRGEILDPRYPLGGFALAVVVPPFELSTPAVFARWDELEGPGGLRIGSADLPPTLRSEEEIINDLYPAAVVLQPELDDWRQSLASIWARPVMLSGSGPTLYGFFLDREEAESAAAAVPAGTRVAVACDLSRVGWRIAND